MQKSTTRALFTAVLLAVSSLPAAAITITPTFTTFGELSAATFAGSGIPNDSVAITTVGGVTLGLSAAQRYGNPVVADDGAGNFFAGTGNDAANGQPGYARWNFNFYVAGLSSGQSVKLYYDLNAAVDNDVTTNVSIPVDFQNSWNLGMNFLSGGTFNPAVAGEYDFALVLLDASGLEVGRSAISVNTVPDSSATLGLLGLGLIGLAGLRRRFVK